MTDNQTLVQSLYAAFGRGDMRAILDQLDPEVEWVCSTMAEVIPWRGTRTGVDGVASFFEALVGTLDFEAFEPRQFFAAGDTVLVLGRTLARVKGRGGRFDSEWAHVFTFTNGKLTRFQEFYDTAAIAAAFAA